MQCVNPEDSSASTGCQSAVQLDVNQAVAGQQRVGEAVEGDFEHEGIVVGRLEMSIFVNRYLAVLSVAQRTAPPTFPTKSGVLPLKGGGGNHTPSVPTSRS
jgi:hypothetical protein